MSSIKYVPYRGELGPLLIIGEGGLAFIERMLASGMVDPKEMEKAYFWRVKPGMLFGFFDSQIESAFADRRILLLGLGADRHHFTASFRSFLEGDDGDTEAEISEEFFKVYSRGDGVAPILDLFSFIPAYGVDAFQIKAYGKESTAITTGYMEIVCWRYIDEDDTTVKLLESHPIADQYNQSLIDRAYTTVFRRGLRGSPSRR